METDSLIINAKRGDIYKYTEEDVEARFYTSNFELNKPPHKGKDKKVIWLMKDESGGKVYERID